MSYKCPKCGGEEFIEQVIEDWTYIVDKNGDVIDMIYHGIDNSPGIFECRKCHYSDCIARFEEESNG